MAVKHDMVAENQKAAGAKQQNLQMLQMLLRQVQTAEPSTYEVVCEAIVKYLCQEPYPAAEPDQIKQFNETLAAYRGQLNDLCADATTETSQLLVHGCLRSLYKQMVEGVDQPCVAAGIILALFNSANIPAAVRWMLSDADANNNSDEALTRVFNTLRRWLFETTSVENIHVWVCELISGLYEDRRFGLLRDLVMGPLPNLLNLVKIPLFRSRALPVLQRMIVCDGGAPQVFHAVLPRLGEVVQLFKGPGNEQEILFLRTIQEMLVQYPSAGNRYNQINDILNVFKHKLAQQLGPSTTTATSLIRLENNNPRVGLVNLGNTCYMNSVLQALVMTKHFSRELLLSYPRTTVMMAGGALKTELVFTIQKLLAQLLHSRRPELTPREVLHVTRPPSFLPGHQQDSSEFLSHLMDTLHEHELAVRKKQQKASGQQKLQPQTPQRRKRPATERTSSVQVEEEDDTGIIVNNRQKMRAELQDQLRAAEREVVLEGDEEEEEEDYEDEVDGAKGGGGGAPVKHTLIQRSFGGLLDTTYHCLSCGQKSTNRDAFRDVSLSFGMGKESKYYVQHLLDYYCVAEQLVGDNQYHCERCAKLCDGVRSMSFVAPPKNLILTLKHFKYDQQFHTRAKLMHNVVLNEMVTLKVHKRSGSGDSSSSSSSTSSSSSSSPTVDGGGETRLAKYQLYAVVVHSGMSMDAGHYYTYASDEPNSWYMFNDSYVTRCAAEDVHRLRAPNTPYILFYRLVEESGQQQQQQQKQSEVEEKGVSGSGSSGSSSSLPELEELPSYLKDFVVKDNFTYCQEMQKGGGGGREEKGTGGGFNYQNRNNNNNNNDSDSDDAPPPTSSCGGNAIDSSNSYIC